MESKKWNNLYGKETAK